MDNLKAEEEFFDKKAEKLFSLSRNALVVDNPADFLAGSLIAFHHMMKIVWPVESRRVLDYGCGSGWLSVYMAKMGAEAYGFDISAKLIEVGNKRAEVNGVNNRVKLEKMNAENLNYPSDFFDTVTGISILHHINMMRGGRELSRVMKKGGTAVFIEPLGENILINIGRDLVQRRLRGERTYGERPLRYRDIQKLCSFFKEVKFYEFQIFGMLEALLTDRAKKFLRLDSIDNLLLERFQFLRKFARLIVIVMTKSSAHDIQ